MNNLKLRIIPIVRILFGAVFIFSAVTKFIDIESFRNALINFNLLYNDLVPFVTYAVPIIEIGLGLLILLNVKPIITIQLTTYLVALFTAVVIAKIFEGAEISCNCFGNFSDDTIDNLTVLRNIFLMLWGIALTVYYNYNEKLKGETNSEKYFSYYNKPWIKQTASLLMTTLFFFLSIQVIVLAIQNRELKSKLSLLIYEKDTLQEGDEAKPFIAQDLNGNVAAFFQNKNDDKKSLLFIFSTGCKACELNMQNWIALADTLFSKNLDVIGLSINSISETINFVQKFSLNFTLYSINDENFTNNYKANKTSQTILVDENNLVIRAWVGILSIYDYVNILEKI